MSTRRSLLPAAPGAALVLLAAATAQAPLQFQLDPNIMPLPQTGPISPAGGEPLVAGDFDGDGDLDLVFAEFPYYMPTQLHLLRNDGHGRFELAPQAGLGSAGWRFCAVAGDFDGDGALDLVTADWGVQNRLLRNNGAGSFTDVTGTTLPGDPATTNLVAAFDADGDGDLDLLFGGDPVVHGHHQLLLNNGQGVFTDMSATHMPNDASNSQAVAVGDVDGDGDPDLVFANAVDSVSGQQNRFYRNQGGGFFADVTTSTLPVDVDSNYSVVLFDADGDGRLEVYFGSWTGVGLYYHYDPTAGAFVDITATHLPATATASQGAMAADIDLDGDVDLVLHSGSVVTLANSGGVFSDETALRVGPIFAYGRLVMGSFDGDRDPDLVGVFWGGLRLGVNHHVQLTTPRIAALGSTTSLDFTSTPRYGAVDHAVIPILGLGLAATPIDFGYGRFWLDPGLSFPSAPLLVAAPAGFLGLPVPVPMDVGLLGLMLHLQSLDYSLGGGAPLFSNLVSVEFRLVRANLLVNGSFELPSLGFGGWNVYPTIPGWTTAWGCGIEVQNHAAGTPLDGSQLVECDSNCSSSFYQDVATVPGSHYVLRFGYSPRPGVVDNTVDVHWAGQLVMTLTANGASNFDTQWTVQRRVVTASGATTRLQFSDASVNDSYGGYLDAVELFEVTFRSAQGLVADLVPAGPLCTQLVQLLQTAAIAHAQNNLAAKQAALQAFQGAVQANSGTAIAAPDAALLVAVAQVL